MEKLLVRCMTEQNKKNRNSNKNNGSNEYRNSNEYRENNKLAEKLLKKQSSFYVLYRVGRTYTQRFYQSDQESPLPQIPTLLYKSKKRRKEYKKKKERKRKMIEQCRK